IFVNLVLAKTATAATAPTYVPGPSSGKISGAPGQTFMAPTSNPTDASTNATVSDYNPANDNPGLYMGLPTQMPEGLTQAPENFWKRDTMFGDVFGLRNQISNYGLEFNPVYTGEV